VHLLPFLAVSALVIVTPGVDMALVTRNALLHGRRAARATALGVNLGIFIWALAAALGLAAVIEASAAAFTAIKLAGAIYLVYLGLRALLGAHEPAAAAPATPSARAWRATCSTPRSPSSSRASSPSSSTRNTRSRRTCSCSERSSTASASSGS
jgi:threonine/homoserine/homoserine lactone efflux protein